MISQQDMDEMHARLSEMLNKLVIENKQKNENNSPSFRAGFLYAIDRVREEIEKL